MDVLSDPIYSPANRNLASALELEAAMFNHRSRYLILYLTLSYRPEYKNYLSLEDIQRDRDHLLNNRRSNTLLQGIKGYVWKIEEGGAGGGLHMHLLIFYSGECHADVYYAREIGEYWTNVITQGRGCYWNSNDNKEGYARYGFGVGIGQINRHDDAKRQALRQILAYLAKEEQQVRSKTTPHDRLFGRSQYPRRD